jgi:carbon-monoxide dehydrogenase small subunit
MKKKNRSEKKRRTSESPPPRAAERGRIAVSASLNGARTTWTVDPAEYLLDTLRREGCFSVKKGCEAGDCGSCTVLLDGQAAASCLLLTGQAQGRSVVTSEGIGTPHEPHALQRCFVETGGTQCGFCIPGMILAAKALLTEHPRPTEEQIREALDGNICRCTGYVKQFDAVRLAANELAKAGK